MMPASRGRLGAGAPAAATTTVLALAAALVLAASPTASLQSDFTCTDLATARSGVPAGDQVEVRLDGQLMSTAVPSSVWMPGMAYALAVSTTHPGATGGIEFYLSTRGPTDDGTVAGAGSGTPSCGVYQPPAVAPPAAMWTAPSRVGGTATLVLQYRLIDAAAPTGPPVAVGNTTLVFTYQCGCLADQFQDGQCGQCQACSATCPAGQATSRNCSALADRGCAACPVNTFQALPSTASACTACKACASGEFASPACSATADTVCKTCRTCEVYEEARVACSATSDTVCASTPARIAMISLLALHDIDYGTQGWDSSIDHCSWPGVTCSGREVTAIVLSNLACTCGATCASLPPALDDLPSLATLRLDDACLAGALPAGLRLPAGLVTLDLGRNALSGPVPAPLLELAVLTALDLGANDLSGTLPRAPQPSLASLDLAGNLLTGALPPYTPSVNATPAFKLRQRTGFVFDCPIPAALLAAASDVVAADCSVCGQAPRFANAASTAQPASPVPPPALAANTTVAYSCAATFATRRGNASFDQICLNTSGVFSYACDSGQCGCFLAGCDGIGGSGLVLDVCDVCGGDGQTCAVTTVRSVAKLDEVDPASVGAGGVAFFVASLADLLDNEYAPISTDNMSIASVEPIIIASLPAEDQLAGSLVTFDILTTNEEVADVVAAVEAVFNIANVAAFSTALRSNASFQALTFANLVGSPRVFVATTTAAPAVTGGAPSSSDGADVILYAVIGAAAVVVLLASLICFCAMKRRQHKTSAPGRRKDWENIISNSALPPIISDEFAAVFANSNAPGSMSTMSSQSQVPLIAGGTIARSNPLLNTAAWAGDDDLEADYGFDAPPASSATPAFAAFPRQDTDASASYGFDMGDLNVASTADSAPTLNLAGANVRESDVDARSRTQSTWKVAGSSNDDDIEVDTYGFMDAPPASAAKPAAPSPEPPEISDDEYSVLPPPRKAAPPPDQDEDEYTVLPPPRAGSGSQQQLPGLSGAGDSSSLLRGRSEEQRAAAAAAREAALKAEHAAEAERGATMVPPKQWTSIECITWLKHHELDDFRETFYNNGFEGRHLVALSVASFANMRSHTKERCQALIDAIRELKRQGGWIAPKKEEEDGASETAEEPPPLFTRAPSSRAPSATPPPGAFARTSSGSTIGSDTVGRSGSFSSAGGAAMGFRGRTNSSLSGTSIPEHSTLEDTAALELARVRYFSEQSMTRKEAEKLLKAEMEDGVYLIRRSTSAENTFVLSMCARNKLQHFPITFREFDHKYCTQLGHKFGSLDSLVQHFKAQAKDGLPCRLRHCCRAYDHLLKDDRAPSPAPSGDYEPITPTNKQVQDFRRMSSDSIKRPYENVELQGRKGSRKGSFFGGLRKTSNSETLYGNQDMVDSFG